MTIDKFRLARYTAVANPAYICYTSHDPFLEAFELYVELDKAANYEREFYKAYKSLAEVFIFNVYGVSSIFQLVNISPCSPYRYSRKWLNFLRTWSGVREKPKRSSSFWNRTEE